LASAESVTRPVAPSYLIFLADAVGHQAEQHHFDHITGVTEVAGGLETALAGRDPFLQEIADGRKLRCFPARLRRKK